MALAPGLPEAYLALGNYQRLVLKNHDRAIEEYNRGHRVAAATADLLIATALAEESLGHWESAVERFRQANRLDPRSVRTHLRLSEALLFLRRYPEAREASDKGLTVAPANLQLIENKAMTFLGEGNLVAARRVIHAASGRSSPRRSWPLWRTTSISSGSSTRSSGRCSCVWRRERSTKTAPPGVSASFRPPPSKGIPRACASTPKSPRTPSRSSSAPPPKTRALRHVFRGLALAYLGRKEEAIREGERGAGLLPVTKDAAVGTYIQHQLARIYIVAGEPDKALDRLEPLLKIPYVLSPGWLKIDPELRPAAQEPEIPEARRQREVIRAGAALNPDPELDGSPPRSAAGAPAGRCARGPRAE